MNTSDESEATVDNNGYAVDEEVHGVIKLLPPVVLLIMLQRSSMIILHLSLNGVWALIRKQMYRLKAETF